MLSDMQPPVEPGLASSPDHRFGLVLSGGGARGAFQVGVWEVLSTHPRGLDGRRPEVISGTSAGAINGALIAAGRSPSEMLDFWLSLGDKPPVTANDRFFASLERALGALTLAEPRRTWQQRARELRIGAALMLKHGVTSGSGRLAFLLEYLLTARFDSLSRLLDGLAPDHLFTTDPFRARLADALGSTTVPPSPVALAINTIDVRTGDVIRYVSRAPKKHADSDDSHYQVGAITVDTIAASAAIPLLFNPVRIGSRDLWDGGLLVNTPLAPTLALGANHIIPVLVTAGRQGAPVRPLSFGHAVERLVDAFLENAYNTDRKLLLERNRLARLRPELGYTVATLYEPIRPASSTVFNAGSYLYFEKTALLDMYRAGRVAAHHWLSQGPGLDKRPGHPPGLAG
jgi:predicted acylesterase/phospholipase RssA